jgi:glycosyltransferase involved in cell wall biosynthesis
MNGNVILSVVVPISKMAERLENLQSWFENLDSEKMQVIFVYDNIDLATSSELKQIVLKSGFSNYQIIDGTFGGPGAARNRGVSECVGQWISFWDSDDFVSTTEYLRAIEKVDESTDLLVGNYEVYDLRSNSITFQLLPAQDQLKRVALNPGIWRMIFRRSAIGDTQFPNLRMAEDQVFICRFLSQNPRIEYSEKVLYRYFIGNDLQLTRNPNALTDLSSASKLTLKVFRNSKEAISDFSAILFERQVITGIKNGKLKTKIALLGVQFLALIIVGPSKISYLVKALAFISSNSTRGSHR